MAFMIGYFKLMALFMKDKDLERFLRPMFPRLVYF
jgi:hypothetical protein